MPHALLWPSHFPQSLSQASSLHAPLVHLNVWHLQSPARTQSCACAQPFSVSSCAVQRPGGMLEPIARQALFNCHLLYWCMLTDAVCAGAPSKPLQTISDFGKGASVTALAFAPEAATSADRSSTGGSPPAAQALSAACLAVGLEDGLISLWSNQRHRSSNDPDHPAAAPDRSADTSAAAGPSAAMSQQSKHINHAAAIPADTHECSQPTNAQASHANPDQPATPVASQHGMTAEPDTQLPAHDALPPQALENGAASPAQHGQLARPTDASRPSARGRSSSAADDSPGQLELVWQSPVALAHCAAVQALAWQGPLEASVTGRPTRQGEVSGSSSRTGQPELLLASCGDDHSVRIFSVLL